MYIYLKSPFSGNQVFMLFICLCGGFNMLLDKPFDNPFVVCFCSLLRYKPVTNHVKGSIPIASMQNIPIPAQNQN